MQILSQGLRIVSQWHKNDPTSHWIKVVDDDNQSKVVGAALWHFYEESPHAKPPEHEMTCYWWPEGPKRIMADEIMGQMNGPRVERMNKPHLCIFPLAPIVHMSVCSRCFIG